MKTTDKELATTSAEINQLFTDLEKKVCPTLGPTCPGCPDCSSSSWVSFDDADYDLAAAPAPVVPTPLGSQRPNADKLHYRHQPVINSVFKISYSPDAEFKTLCQDCLRVVCHPTKQAMDMAHDEFFFCDCGGQLCACSDCSDAAALLARNGSSAIVELARLGAIKPITGPFIYSPATGIVREQSK